MKTTKSSEFTKKEREMIENFCKPDPRGKEYGQLRVLRYNGFNSALRELNGTAKSLGVIHLNKRENVWYFDAINGERYRIPEREDGIFGDENGKGGLLEVEFKRKDV